ncbi:MAG TPA: MFS transporter [Solirubrobacteraceae bacterium]|jgi:MFS family permease|nr:MFS transporter [Solirubrobacteraceae bacterium]
MSEAAGRLVARAAQLARSLAVRAARALGGQVVQLVGGPARARVILMFGAVLGLSGADTATVGAAAPQLERTLHIGNAEIGLLSSVTLLVGALFVIPVGVLVDHVKRMPLLAVSIGLWSVASLAGGFAGSYGTLLLTRLALGAVTATAGPAIASLTGDYFPASERGRVYAYILGGEIAGSAAGFIVGGTVASAISWHVAFVLLSLPGFWLARALWRTVPEPARGGHSRLARGVASLEDALLGDRAEADPAEWSEPGRTEAQPAPEESPAVQAVRRHGVQADPELVLERDARTMGVLEAIRYILRIPSYALMVISSSLGYFFFSGLQTFVLLFMRGHYHIGQAEAELVVALLVLGALAGTLASGRLTDALLRRGVLEARIWVPAGCYLGAAALLVPGLLIGHLTPALWFDLGGTALISAANPPQDAARLDIMPAGLWGRAEATRSFLRSLAQALAPLVFGGLADAIAGIVPAQAPIGTHAPAISPSTARGLEISFLLLLTTLAAAGVFLLRARATYPGDVATAAAARRPSEP